MGYQPSEHNSRFVIVICALAGFLIAFFGSMSTGNAVTTSLFRSSIGMLVGGILGSIFMRYVYVTSKEIRNKKQQELTRKRIEEEARKRAEEEGDDQEEEETEGDEKLTKETAGQQST